MGADTVTQGPPPTTMPGTEGLVLDRVNNVLYSFGQANSPQAVSGKMPVSYLKASGAIPVAPGSIGLDGTGAMVMTLATPTTPAQDGITIEITALTAHAHTVTTAANKINGIYDTVTFAAIGDIVILEAMNGLWIVKYIGGPTPAALSEV